MKSTSQGISQSIATEVSRMTAGCLAPSGFKVPCSGPIAGVPGGATTRWQALGLLDWPRIAIVGGLSGKNYSYDGRSGDRD
jgi:hypothetical protein